MANTPSWLKIHLAYATDEVLDQAQKAIVVELRARMKDATATALDGYDIHVPEGLFKKGAVVEVHELPEEFCFGWCPTCGKWTSDEEYAAKRHALLNRNSKLACSVDHLGNPCPGYPEDVNVIDEQVLHRERKHPDQCVCLEGWFNKRTMKHSFSHGPNGYPFGTRSVDRT